MSVLLKKWYKRLSDSFIPVFPVIAIILFVHINRPV